VRAANFVDPNTTAARYLPRSVRRWFGARGNRFGITPVLVYQMAKVGSSAVLDALDAAGIPAFHVHRMDAGHLRRMRAARRALGWYIIPVPPHDRLGLRLRRDLLDRGRRAAIVTLVRDPIARNLSSYFEHLDAIWHRVNAHLLPIEELIAGFFERYTHDEPLTWFDDEMLPATGIDVYTHPFPAGGVLTVTAGALDLLILRSELPDAEKADALSTFLGVAGLTLGRANTTGNKAKGEVYRRFVDRIRFPASYVQSMLQSRYARHFYTGPELEEMARRYPPA
jgi:hypothetical protein